MEENLPAQSMSRGTSHGLLELQGSMHLHHPQPAQNSVHHFNHQMLNQINQSHSQGLMVHPPIPDVFLPSATHMQECSRTVDFNVGGLGKTSTSDEDDPSLNTEDGVDGHNESGKGKMGSPWHRMKWTDEMVRLLITAVSYAGEDASSECNNGGKRKVSMLQKKGKWKSISTVMGERDYYVSPQQCEDKFNDLNKRYKRLTDILGRGTSCKVVENPTLLDLMHHLSDKTKDNVKKILSSKHLFYEEMCSYHNGNRMNLPADPSLQRSLQLALRSRDEHDTMTTLQEDTDEEDQGAYSDDGYDAHVNNSFHKDIKVSCFLKKTIQGVDHEQVGLGNPLVSQNCNKRPHPLNFSVDINQVFPEGSNTDSVQEQQFKSRSLQLEEQRLHIQAQMLELEQQRFKWQQFSKKKDRELEKMKLENEKMKLENERLALELKRKQLEIDLN